MSGFEFELQGADGAARQGVIRTPRGDICTPAFMPVGTAGTVKAMLPQSVRQTGADILLGNSYHLMLRPGAERVARLGGLAQIHGLGAADSYRLRRVSGDVACVAAQDRRGGGALPMAYEQSWHRLQRSIAEVPGQ